MKTKKKILNSIPFFLILLSTYVFLIIAAILSLSYYSYLNATNLAVEKTNKYSYEIMQEKNEQITSLVQTTIEEAFNIANDDDLFKALSNFQKGNEWEQIGFEEEVTKITEGYWRMKPHILYVTVFSDKKNYAGSSMNGILPIKLIEQLDWFRELGSKNGVLIDSNLLDYLNGRRVENATTILVKIKNRSGGEKKKGDYKDEVTKHENINDDEDLGVLAVNIAESYLFEHYLSRTKVSDNSIIYIINSKGTIISGTDKSLLGKRITEDKNVEGIISKTEGGYRTIIENKRKFLQIYTPVSKIGWRIVQWIPVSELKTGSDRIQKAVITFAILLLLLVLPIAVLMSTYISKPVTKIASIMKHIKTGEIVKAEANVYGKEINELFTSYNFMVDKINELVEGIQKAGEIQRQTEIKALQAQINPHFLYNTLDSINWMALESNAPDISRMVTMLSRLFRLSLSKGRTIYRVKDEFEHVKYYLEIQKIRFKDRFHYLIEIEDGIEDFLIPKLILQPLAENSIVHGFRDMLSSGFIDIKAKIAGDDLCIELSDNGRGISPDDIQDLLKIDSKKGGYGVKNVHERIKYICGEKYGLQYLTGNQTGTHIRITLPKTDNPDILNQN